MTTQPPQRPQIENIYNFNLNEVFDLTQDYRYFKPLTPETIVATDPDTGTVAFRYNNSKTPGGVILKMATIPGEVYHVFLTGQLNIGNVVGMIIKNQCPEINLAQTKIWHIGCQEVQTACFTPISHQTDLILTTDTQCFCNYAPYEFYILGLSIIPDTLMCQGYILGTQGQQGTQGIQGTQGLQGTQSAVGQQGSQGLPGPQGSKGSQGPQGIKGSTGIIGQFGPTGTAGTQNPIAGPQGIAGDTGIQGPMGQLGTVGPIGSQGLQGFQGNPGYVLDTNVFIGSTFYSSWTRGTAAQVAINVPINYQITAQSTTLKIGQFVSTGSGFVTSCLSSDTLPSPIRTSPSRETTLPCLIIVNGISKKSAIQLGPVTITIYSDEQLSCGFLFNDIVFFPEQTFTYLIGV